jgi:hypothetical protein
VSWIECVLDDDEERKLSLEVLLNLTLYSNPSYQATSSSPTRRTLLPLDCHKSPSSRPVSLVFVAYSLGYVRHQNQSSPPPFISFSKPPASHHRERGKAAWSFSCYSQQPIPMTTGNDFSHRPTVISKAGHQQIRCQTTSLSSLVTAC